MRRIAGLAVVGIIGLPLAYGFTRNSEAELYVTAPIERGIIATHVKATGIVDPVVTVDVNSQLSGRVAAVLVNFNDEVHKDQVIARLDPQVYDARVSEARAVLKVAKASALLQKASLERAMILLQILRRQRRWKRLSCGSLRPSKKSWNGTINGIPSCPKRQRLRTRHDLD